jgi:hypothetical protein
LAAIHDWLETCQTHPRCRRSLSGTTSIDAKDVLLPTRCIEIAANTIRLCLTFEQKGSYLTLSHRWNDETEVSSTTRVNYNERLVEISHNTLPKTFRDAINITRRLGIKYLWIDSICIIQKDEKDWGFEASRMAEYYQHSQFTIAATGSTDEKSDGGFLHRDNSAFFDNLVRLPYRDINGEHQGYFYAQKRRYAPDESYRSAVLESALMGRGWVFQEWMLSRRIIHFSKHGLFFECSTHLATNEFQERLKPQTHWQSDSQLGLKFSLDYNNFEDLDVLWFKLVEAYSKLALTHPEKDRILAISGVAKEHRAATMAYIGSERPPEYMSGLWLRNIHQGLLWEQKEEQREESEVNPPSSTPPSWSWSSLMAGVKWADVLPSTQNKCSILSVEAPGGKYHDIEYSAEGLRAKYSDDENDPFDVTLVVTKLKILGKLLPVLISHTLKDRSDMTDNMAKFTNHKPAFGRGNWRAVCQPETPDLIARWSSIERPGLLAQSSSTRFEATALLISSHRVSGGLTFGYFGWRHDVLNVIFVRRKEGIDEHYQRIGVGRIFDKDLAQAFTAAENETFYLV